MFDDVLCNLWNYGIIILYSFYSHFLQVGRIIKGLSEKSITYLEKKKNSLSKTALFTATCFSACPFKC